MYSISTNTNIIWDSSCHVIICVCYDVSRRCSFHILRYLSVIYMKWGARGSVAGRGTTLQAGESPVRVPNEVDFFNWPNPSSRTMALESTQPLTEMSTKNLPWGKGRPVQGWQRCRHLWANCLENVRASTSRNHKGLHGLYRENFAFTCIWNDVNWRRE
jgi:hypothetical protein